MSIVSVVTNALGDVRLHRFAAAVAAVAVALVGAAQTNGTDLGLDSATVQTIVGFLGVVAAVAREIAAPVILAPFFNLFSGGK